MNVDIFQTPGYFPNNDPALGCGYGLVASIDFIPVMHSFFCDVANDKAYQVMQILYSKDRDRAIVITVPQMFSVQKIFEIPGEHPTSAIDIFINVTGKIPDNAPDPVCGYGLVASVDFTPAIHSFYCNVDQDKVYEVTHLLYSKDPDRTIVLTTFANQSVQNIFNIPGESVS